MYCRDCKHSSPYEYSKYNPQRGAEYMVCEKIEDAAMIEPDEWVDDRVVYHTDDGATVTVGPMYGCIHYEKKDAKCS